MQLAVTLIILRTLDILTTLYHTGGVDYAVEGNPVTRSMMQVSFPFFLFTNALVSILVALAAYFYADRSFIVRNVTRGLIVASGLAVAINFSLIFV